MNAFVGENTMSAVEAPQIIGKRYQLLAEIGAGNMGKVHRALDRLTGRMVALKQVYIPLEQLRFGSRSSNNKDLQITLAREFRILASLRHPHIIGVLDYGFSRGETPQPYVTMELLENASTIIEATQNKPYAERVALLAQMLQALAYLHRRGVLHRDLKPGNVLVADEQVKLLDFGLSVTDDAVRSDEIAGTPMFMAPELWTGDAATRQSDLYAFGVIAYRVFAGKLPFEATDIRTLIAKILHTSPDLNAMQAEDAIKSLIGRLLGKYPHERYADAGEVLALLRQASGHPIAIETAATRESFLQAAAFVGREAEQRRLNNVLDSALNGKGSVWLVGGESGVGKSRLLDELRTRALVQGALVMRGQAVVEGGPPFYVLRDSLSWLALLVDPSDRDAAVLKPLVNDIDRLLGREISDAPQVTPQAAQARLIKVIEGMFRALASAERPQPVVLLLEDLHWADTETLVVLERLAQTAHDLPLLVIGTYADDENANLPLLVPGAQKHRLERLSERETALLTEGMLGKAGRNPELLRLLQDETEGNAFFLVEVVRALAEEAGQLGDVGAAAPLPMHVLTGGVQGIVQRRLHRVPEGARLLLKAAAVAGRQLDLDVLYEVLQSSGNDREIETWLIDCADAAVLEVQDGNWRFGHNKLREGVLSDLDSDELLELHCRVAGAIESVYQYSSRRTAEALMYHWSMAGDREKEEHYAALAGEQALHSGAYAAAKTFLKRALDLQAHVESSKRKQAMLKGQLGEACLELNQPDEAKTYLEESLALCREIGYRWGMASALTRLGTAASRAGDDKTAEKLMTDALKAAMESRALAVALSTLAAFATLLAKMGEKREALEYASLVIHHPSCDGATHYVADKLIASLKAELSSEEAETAMQRGASRELKEVAGHIIGESSGGE
jgi:eukaryotic-like serine/threonine-protein kinase